MSTSNAKHELIDIERCYILRGQEQKEVDPLLICHDRVLFSIWLMIEILYLKFKTFFFSPFELMLSLSSKTLVVKLQV